MAKFAMSAIARATSIHSSAGLVPQSIAETLSTYLPMDRRHALARGESLPDRTFGAALFADISGFTPLTEALMHRFGPRRGAEELTHQLNRVYDAVIAEVDRFGGSVIGFSGDAITCWFDQNDERRTMKDEAKPARSSSSFCVLHSAFRATACALALQDAMRAFAAISLPDGSAIALAMKVAVASGPVRRLCAGDPAVQYIDVLVGATLTRMAAGEHLADKGQVLVDKPTAERLGTAVHVTEWRIDPDTGAPFAVVGGLMRGVRLRPWPPLPTDALPAAALRLWLLPTVYARLSAGLGEFLTELRPTVALFLCFGGIDYDDAAAGIKLDNYIRWVQEVLVHYQGTLIQLTIGDKGSYLYAAFGAPIAHEDDARRAVAAALELRHPPAPLNFIRGVRIGISQGTMRTGVYGGMTRRTYGVLGDEANLAARLMSHAAPDQVLAHERVRRATADVFVWKSLPAIRVKGKSEPVPVVALLGARPARTIHMQEPAHALPLIGREGELALIVEKLDQALTGHGQIVGITGEAGIGKSRLVAEVIRLARARGLTCYGGECQSYGTNSSYLVWRPIWHAFFGLDSTATEEEQVRTLATVLRRMDPALLPRLPLLGTILDLPIPAPDLTAALTPRVRKTSREALLVDCLQARVRGIDGQALPLLLVLEDTHWLDSLSQDLLLALGQAVVDVPVLIVLAFRPPSGAVHELPRRAPRVMDLPHSTTIALTELKTQQAERLIQAKLVQRSSWADDGVEIPAGLVARIIERSQGNPFYMEELLNYLHDQGLNRCDPATLDAMDLPTSLHSLLLSRMDQLDDRQQITLKVASIIGRMFRVAWLHGYYPTLGELPEIIADLELLSRLELTALEAPAPALAYLFKHVVTQEVAYESLSYATRARLHEQLAHYLEAEVGADTGPAIDRLAYHYTRSANVPKQRQYLRQAGDAASATYANEAAIDYYERLLPLLNEPAAQVDVLLVLEIVLERVGRWEAAEARARQALDLAVVWDDRQVQARCEQALGIVLGKRGEYHAAGAWLKRAQQGGDAMTQITALIGLGEAATVQSDYAQAADYLQDALGLAQAASDQRMASDTLSRLSHVAFLRGAYTEMRHLAEAAHACALAAGDPCAQALALRRMGVAAFSARDGTLAAHYAEQSLALYSQIGDREGIAACLVNLGHVTRIRGDYATANRYAEKGLRLSRELGDRRSAGIALFNMGFVANAKGDYATAAQQYAEGLAHAQALSDRRLIGICLHGLGFAAAGAGDVRAAERYYHAALAETIGSGGLTIVLWAIVGIAQLQLRAGQPERAAELIGLVLGHPASGADMAQLAEPVLEAVRAALTVEALESALARGHARDLGAVVAELLAGVESATQS